LPVAASSSSSSSSDTGTSVGDYLHHAMTSVVDSGSIASVYFAACGTKTGMALLVVLIINVFFAGISSLTVRGRRRQGKRKLRYWEWLRDSSR
jgi:peptidoglycan biosynthesis protein MviN/MurJ (putative lipid II flippase)